MGITKAAACVVLLPGAWELGEKIGEWRNAKIQTIRTRDTLKWLERLQKLYESGGITRDEYEKLKARLIGKI